MKISAEQFSHFSFPVTLTFDLRFAPLVTLVQRHVYAKLEVSATFLLQENRQHGTDRQGATLNAVPHGGSHTAVAVTWVMNADSMNDERYANALLLVVKNWETVRDGGLVLKDFQ